MKYTLCVTQRCNLACTYCYVGKREEVMPLDIARHIVDFAFERTPPHEKIEIGFFGGEPLLAFERIRDITELIEAHADFAERDVEMTVVSNGTTFSDEIADYLLAHAIGFGVSCDGPPAVQDHFRRYADGGRSSPDVENTLLHVIERIPYPMVNAVYHPETFLELPRVVRYFSELGLRRIYLNPDFSATWTQTEAEVLPSLYSDIRKYYSYTFLKGDPHFISFLDGKISVVLRGGYGPLERCRMGRGEYAFSVEGNIYPCERLLGDGKGGGHCIGNIETGLVPSRIGEHCNTSADDGEPCRSCGLREYCMNWCGCSNYMSGGSYDAPGAFLCASERAAIETAMSTIEALTACGHGSELFAHVFRDQVIEEHEQLQKGGDVLAAKSNAAM